MIDGISDSETEFEPIPISGIQVSQVRHKVAQLAPEVRQIVVNKLNSTIYRSIFQSSSTNNQSIQNNQNNQSIDNDTDDTHGTYEELERQEIQQALSTIQPLADTHGRRGLRKRKFASTHPYLVDQAHWLDLASIEYLNDIYEENQDIEMMLKFLNSRYLKLKNRYPNEERYKSKSFFRFLGRTNPNAVNGSLSQSDPNALEMTQDASLPQEEGSKLDGIFSDSSEYESEDDMINIRHKHSFVSDSDNEGSIASDASSGRLGLIDTTHLNVLTGEDTTYATRASQDDIIVRVGGRVRKKKTVLRGVLPESAKRLDIWTGKQRSKSAPKRKDIEKRKGLAMKKKSNGSGMAPFSNESDLYKDLIVADDEAEDEGTSPAEYLNYSNRERDTDLQAVEAASDIFAAKYGSFYSSDTDSDSEPEVMEVPELDLFGHIPPQPPHDSYRDVLKQSTLDESYNPGESSHQPRFNDRSEINPDFVRTGHTGSRSKLNKESKRPKNAATLGLRSYGSHGRHGRRGTGVKSLPKRTLQSTKRKGIQTLLSSKRQHTSIGGRGRAQGRLNVSGKGSITLNSSIPQEGKRHPSEEQKSSEEQKIPTPEEQKKKKGPQHYEVAVSSRYKKKPLIFTPVFEVESTNKFVRNHVNQILNRSHIPDTSKTSILDVDVTLLSSLKDGYTPIGISSPLSVIVQGQRYAFNLVAKHESRLQAQNLLLKLCKITTGEKIDDSTSAEVKEALKVLIKWFLSLQEPPSETESRSSKLLLKRVSRHQCNDNLILLALSVCLEFIFFQLYERTAISKESRASFTESAGLFWYVLFNEVNSAIESENLALVDTPFQLVWQLLSFDTRLFWSIICDEMPKFPRSGLRSYLEGLFYVANHIEGRNYDWSPFYALYSLAEQEDKSEFYKDYLDICFLLNQRKSWPFEEKLILQLYSTITKRRFFNFDDEGTSIITLSKIYTFNDIPSTTFFECFMGFLYNYVSSLPDLQSSKRLATKLLTSSHYQYQNTKSHQNAFVNRFNFIIILSQMTSLNQNNQVNSLVETILDSNNIDIYSLAIKELKTYCDILNGKLKPLPLDSIRNLLEKSSSLYFHVPGISKILVQMSACLKQCFKLDFFDKPDQRMVLDFFRVMAPIDLKNLHDDVAVRVFDLLSTAAKFFVQNKPVLPQKDQELLKNVIDSVKSVLSHRMGGFPMQTRIRENRLIGFVEQGFKIWTSLCFVVDPNWNKIIYQDFPYIGNSYSREKFVLDLFCNILEFNELEQHRDMIIETLLKQLAKFHISKYVVNIMNSLRRLKSYVVEFKKIHLNRSLAEVEVTTNRTQITLTILSNVISFPSSDQTKINMMVGFLTSLNDEYDKHFKSSSYIDLCKKLIEFVQLNAGEYVVDSALYQELANKLDVTPVSSNQVKWKSFTQLEKLTFLHKEFIASITYEKDVFTVLDQYTDPEGFNSIFHLTSIYMKCIVGNQYEFWLVVSTLLDYIVYKLDTFKVDIHSREFAKFLLSLKDMTALCYSRWTNRFSSALTNFQLKSICQTYQVLKKAFFIYDGFKDQKFVADVIDRQLLDFALPSTKKVTELEWPYSSFEFYDISNNKQELLNLVESQLLKPEFEKYRPEEDMAELRLLMDNRVCYNTLEIDSF